MRPILGVLGLVAVLFALTASASSAQSPPGSAGAKAAAKCQQTIARVNAKFLAQRLKRLATCSTAVLACIQVQSGVPACIGKATDKCRKQLGTPDQPDTPAAKLEAAVIKACGGLPSADLLAAGGLAFGNAETACAGVGVAPLAGAADVARCLQRLHAGLSEESFGAELPRATELTGQGGVSALLVPDLPIYGGCGDCATPPAATGKAVAACGVAITKAGAGFLAKARSGLDKCATAFVGCAQQKPNDPGCVAKAKATCQKLPADLAAGRTKLLTALQKKCSGTLAFATLQAPSGVNLGALACECQQVGVAPVASLDDYAVCLARQHECRLAALLPAVVPGVDGLLAAQGLGVKDLLCAPAATAVTLARFGPRPLGVFGGIGKVLSRVFPGSLKSSALPSATRGTAPRVGRPSFAGCRAAPGRTCAFRFPIHKSPFGLQRGVALPPTLIVGAQRADGEPADDHYELALGDTSNESEIEVLVTYADDLASCDFQLVLSVMEGGEVSTYTALEQTPHVIPANDECTTARPITTASFTDVLDVTEATVFETEAVPTCAAGGLGNTVWYQFTAPSNGIITADTFGSDYDTEIAVWSGTCGALTQRTCVSDSGGTLQSKVAMPVLQGTTYLVQVNHAGIPGESSTLHFAFRFEAAGEPPTISKPTATLVEINSPTFCSANNGTAFNVEFDFVDPDGDVLPNTAGVSVSAHFEPSGGVSDFFVPPPLAITGDGFSGHVSVLVCTFFSSDTRVDTILRLVDFAGAGNAVSVKIDRPAGAN